MDSFVNVETPDEDEFEDEDDRIEPSQIAPPEIVEETDAVEVEESSDYQDAESETEYSQDDREADVQQDISKMMKVSFVYTNF